MAHVTRVIPFRITVCGIEELAGHCETGASYVLSILDPDHPVPEAFGRFGFCRNGGSCAHMVTCPPRGHPKLWEMGAKTGRGHHSCDREIDVLCGRRSGTATAIVI